MASPLSTFKSSPVSSEYSFRSFNEAIYWHPGMKWVIDAIYVQKPIRFTSIRRNEVQSKISANNVLGLE